MKTLLFTASILLTTSAFAEYCPIDQKGSPKIPFGHVVTQKKTDKNFEVITIEPSKENPYGGSRQEWRIERDSSGRIVSIESGLNIPSQKIINFEIAKRKFEKENSSLPEDKMAIVPSLNDLKTLSFDSSLAPIKFGSKIEMTHSSSNCTISKISNKFYDPQQKTSYSSSIFESSKCIEVTNFLAQKKPVLDKCESTENSLFDKIAQSFNSANISDIAANSHLPELTSGAGGGGGFQESAKRTPASMIGQIAPLPKISESTFSIADQLSNNSSKAPSLNEISKLCDVFAPKNRSNSLESETPSSGAIRN